MPAVVASKRHARAAAAHRRGRSGGDRPARWLAGRRRDGAGSTG